MFHSLHPDTMLKKLFLSLLFFASFANADVVFNGRLEVPYSTTTAQVVATTDASNYSCVSVHTTSSGTASVVTFQQSNDNVNWIGMQLGYDQEAPAFTALNYTSSSAGHIFFGSLSARYFRLSVTGISAGTTAGVIEFFSNCRVPTASIISATQFTSVYPTGFTAITATSGVVANTTATATLAAASGVHTWISGFQITAAGATAASEVTCTITGTTVTQSFIFSAPAGVTTEATPLIVHFAPALESSSTNTAIAISCPALGSGNTATAVNAQGFQQ